MNLKTLAKSSPVQNPSDEDALPPLPSNLRAMRLAAVLPDGMLLVEDGAAPPIACLWLEGRSLGDRPLEPGDRLLIACIDQALPPVALGRIGRYSAAPVPAQLHLQATESLTLKCGEASVELRADGRAMVKGEDVLLRAKGTQRIRAGNVAIN